MAEVGLMHLTAEARGFKMHQTSQSLGFSNKATCNVQMAIVYSAYIKNICSNIGKGAFDL